MIGWCAVQLLKWLSYISPTRCSHTPTLHLQRALDSQRKVTRYMHMLIWKKMIEGLLLLHCVFLRKWARYVPRLTVCTVTIQGAGMVHDRGTSIPPGGLLKNTHSRDSAPGILNRTMLRQARGAKRESSFPRGNESQQRMGVIEERLVWGWRQGRDGSGAVMVGQVERNGSERTMLRSEGSARVPP